MQLIYRRLSEEKTTSNNIKRLSQVSMTTTHITTTTTTTFVHTHPHRKIREKNESSLREYIILGRSILNMLLSANHLQDEVHDYTLFIPFSISPHLQESDKEDPSHLAQLELLHSVKYQCVR